MRARVPSSTRSPTTAFARRLRASLTEPENRLWYYLRDRRFCSAKFRRQVPIGPYVVDFLCIAAMLVVEVDGGQHSERAAYDEVRTRFLDARGYRVMRFWNNDVMGNIDGVMEVIAKALAHNRSAAGGRGEYWAAYRKRERGTKAPSPLSDLFNVREGTRRPLTRINAGARTEGTMKVCTQVWVHVVATRRKTWDSRRSSFAICSARKR